MTQEERLTESMATVRGVVKEAVLARVCPRQGVRTSAAADSDAVALSFPRSRRA
jgi:hypothetical protein